MLWAMFCSKPGFRPCGCYCDTFFTLLASLKQGSAEQNQRTSKHPVYPQCDVTKLWLQQFYRSCWTGLRLQLGFFIHIFSYLCIGTRSSESD